MGRAGGPVPHGSASSRNAESRGQRMRGSLAPWEWPTQASHFTEGQNEGPERRRGLREVSSRVGCGRWFCVVRSTQRPLTRGVGGGTIMPLKPPQTWGLYQLVGAPCVQQSATGREQTDYGKWQSLSTARTADCRKTLQEGHGWNCSQLEEPSPGTR